MGLAKRQVSLIESRGIIYEGEDQREQSADQIANSCETLSLASRCVYISLSVCT